VTSSAAGFDMLVAHWRLGLMDWKKLTIAWTILIAFAIHLQQHSGLLSSSHQDSRHAFEENLQLFNSL
jgi:hypothetical protein